jgi:Lysophospholipase
VDASPQGAKVTLVVPASAAQYAGIRVGDVILKVGQTEVTSPAQFAAMVKALPPGKPVSFVTVRNGIRTTLPVVLHTAPLETDRDVPTRYEAVSVDGSLRRTLVTLPAAVRGRHPALLILGGIGCYSVDNAADREDAYRHLAHDLGRRGIIVMRWEKSGVGDSRGPPCATVDLASEMRSYAAALEALRAHSFVDPDRVYLFGHSIGTLIAPRLALDHKVAGVIVAEGVGRNWIEYELLNLRRQLQLEGEPADQIDERMRLKELCAHRLLVEKADEGEIEKAEPACKEMNAYPASASYMQQAASLNIAEPWTRLAMPMLAIYGTADFVTAEDDHRRIVDIVNSVRPGLATLKLVPGMDHHLDYAGTQQQAWDLRVRQKQTLPYDSRFSDAVGDWLCAREHCLKQANSLQASTG